MKNIQKLWRYLIIPLYIVILFHFIKDVTQDIFDLDTFMNNIGDINENISNFPMWLTWFYHWAMVNTFFMEAILLFTLIIDWKNKQFTKISVINISMILYIFILFTTAFILQ